MKINNPEVSPATIFALLVLISGMAFGQDKPKPSILGGTTTTSSLVITFPIFPTYSDNVVDGKHTMKFTDPENKWVCAITSIAPPAGNNVLYPNDPTSVTIVCLKKLEAVHEPK